MSKKEKKGKEYELPKDLRMSNLMKVKTKKKKGKKKSECIFKGVLWNNYIGFTNVSIVFV